MKQKIAERDAQRSGGQTVIGTTVLQQQTTIQAASITQGNQLIVADHPTLTSDYATMTSDYATLTSDFDSTVGLGVSLHTRSSRASQSDMEFSESYL